MIVCVCVCLFFFPFFETVRTSSGLLVSKCAPQCVSEGYAIFLPLQTDKTDKNQANVMNDKYTLNSSANVQNKLDCK